MYSWSRIRRALESARRGGAGNRLVERGGVSREWGNERGRGVRGEEMGIGISEGGKGKGKGAYTPRKVRPVARRRCRYAASARGLGAVMG